MKYKHELAHVATGVTLFGLIGYGWLGIEKHREASFYDHYRIFDKNESDLTVREDGSKHGSLRIVETDILPYGRLVYNIHFSKEDPHTQQFLVSQDSLFGQELQCTRETVKNEPDTLYAVALDGVEYQDRNQVPDLFAQCDELLKDAYEKYVPQ